MMFMNPGDMFLGCLGSTEQKFLYSLFKTARKAGYTRFVEPCAGTFAMANLAVDTGYKPEQIETSDVSMMPTILGYAVCGKPLDELEIRAKGFADEELLDPATALYAQLYLRTVKKAGTEYFHNLLADLSYNREKYIAQIRESIEKNKQRLGGMNYRPMCMFDHLKEVLDDEHAIVIANPPTYFSGYEKYYDTAGAMTWKEPPYELFDPSTGHGKLFEMVKDAKALVLCYQEKPAGEYVGDAIYARAATRKGMNAYLCSNRGEEAEALAHGKKIKRPNESALEPLPCSIMPTDYDITENSDLKIIKVKAANTQYYRKLWTHNFVGSSATFNFAVLIDGLVAGVFGISKMTAEALFIWYVMKVPHKELRLGRLMYMLAQNRSLTDTVTNDFERERVVCVRTAMLTKYPENKEVRGIMKMTERKKDKEHGFKLTYEAPIIEGRSEKATLTEWLRREKEWQAKRNATK